MRAFLNDLRYAGRALRRNPGFAFLTIGIMALGIGANTAVFSIVNGVLLKPLPYPGADRIVALHTVYLTDGAKSELVSIANYRDWRDQSSSFEAFASYRGGGETPISSGTTAEYTHSATVDFDFFRVFGVQPILGRTFTRDEDRARDRPRGGHQPFVLAEPVWRRSRGAESHRTRWPDRAGDRRGHAGRLQFPGETDVWGPQTTSATSRSGHNFNAVARLKPEVSIEQARAELTAIAARLAAAVSRHQPRTLGHRDRASRRPRW